MVVGENKLYGSSYAKVVVRDTRTSYFLGHFVDPFNNPKLLPLDFYIFVCVFPSLLVKKDFFFGH